MGLKPIPSLAQAITDGILETIEEFAKGFIDDFFLYSMTYTRAVAEIRKFFIVCSYYNLKLKPQKCNLLKRVQTFLGYRVSHKAVHRLIPSKITNLKNIKSPTTKDELKSILGIFAWFQNRAFLRESTHLLRQLAKQNIRFRWTEEHEKQLRKSIDILLSPTTV